jgi:electron transport complex protein RnfD
MTMRFDTGSPPHGVSSRSVRGVMLLVVVALFPAIIAHSWHFGAGIILNLAIAVLTAAIAEALALAVARKCVNRHLGDGSALVTAALIALCLPPLTPAWVTISGTLFAILIAKHAFGGLGYNPFNPAMAGYAMLLIAFPAQLSGYPAAAGSEPGAADTHAVLTVAMSPDLQRSLSRLSNERPSGQAHDAITRATPLDAMQSALGQRRMVSEVLTDIETSRTFSRWHGRGWDWISAALLLGGVFLLGTRVVPWQAPAGMLIGITLPALLFHVGDADHYPGAAFHLGAPSTMLAAFFIVTDPVSGATSPRGRLVFGLLTGLLAWTIRTVGAYPDGVAFAVLLANLTVPLLDRLTRPRVYGHGT